MEKLCAMMTLSMCSLPCGAAAAGAAGGNGRGAVSRIMNKDERYTEIDLAALLKAFWRHIWLILAAIAVLGGMAFAYARFMITPMYTASALMYVNNNSLSVGSTKVSLSYSDLTAAKSLVDTYVVILNARTTLNEVIRTSGVDYTYKEMQSMVSAGAVNSTEVVQIDVTMPDPQEAERVANTITKVELDLSGETESIGGAALEELSKQVVAANGPAIDGVAGATVTTKAVRKAVAAALGVELAEEAPADSAAAAPAEPAAIVPVEGGIQIGQAYAAAHGTKCFTEAVAVVKDDVILAAYLDDFQFTSADAGVTAVPNSDSDFAAGYAEGKVLMSKRANADYYSKMMAEKGGSTVALDANFDAIQNFAVGKTISELEDVAAKGAEAVDAVSGATLVDTAGYLSAIVDAAKNAQTTQAVEFNGSSEDLKLNVVYGAAHGTKCFTSGAVATAGDTIVLSYIDEFQFAGSDAGVVGVPNSDSDFGVGYAEGKVLMSKRVNADYYSKMMAEKAGSTVSLDANYDAIQNHVNGMSIADAEALSKDEKAVDAVSGATLVDTAGYIGVLVDAAK